MTEEEGNRRAREGQGWLMKTLVVGGDMEGRNG